LKLETALAHPRLPGFAFDLAQGCRYGARRVESRAPTTNGYRSLDLLLRILQLRGVGVVGGPPT
jgi:hypothetical protein